MKELQEKTIKAVIGLGNPGPKFYRHRHNIGFRILDALAQEYGGSWQTKGEAQVATIIIGTSKLVLVKPQTFMNLSGRVVPALLKQGVAAENILVVHDELEQKLGSLKFKVGGSHRGHNGLRSIIGVCGPDFARLRFGIGRPNNKYDVPDYVLQPFNEPDGDIEQLIERAVVMIESIFQVGQID